MPDSSLVRSVPADGLFAGIDWGNAHHQLCLVDPQSEIVHQARYDHDVAGLAGSAGPARPAAAVAIERAEGLLVETLQERGHRLFCVSPKMSARARERYRVAPGKSDAFDAFVLAGSLGHEHRHWRPLAVPSPRLAELRALTRDRKRLVWNQRDTENQLRAIVLAYHPAVLKLFSQPGPRYLPGVPAGLPDPGPGRAGRRRADGRDAEATLTLDAPLGPA